MNEITMNEYLPKCWVDLHTLSLCTNNHTTTWGVNILKHLKISPSICSIPILCTSLIVLLASHISVHFSKSLLNKTDEKPKPKTFHFEGSCHFWIGAQLEVRQSSWLLFSKNFSFSWLSKRATAIYFSPIEVAHKMKKVFGRVWPDFDPTWSLWWLSCLQWVSDGSPSHSHATKIENNNQFVPVNTNPKEFKKVQKLVRRKRSFREASAKDNVSDERGP